MPDLTPDSAEDMWSLASVEPKHETTDSTQTLSWWAKVGLTGLFLSLVTPLVGLAGLWAAAGLGQLAALGLETSRAKLPMIVVDPNWDIRVVFVFALVVLGLRVAVSSLPRPTWKVAGLGPWSLWLGVGGVLWTTTGTTLALERHVLDLADGIHLVILGATTIWTTTTAMWLIGSVGHGALVGVRIAARRSAVASGVAAVVGILTMAVATPLLANPELLDGSEVYRDAPVLAAIKSDVEDAGHMLAANMTDQPLQLEAQGSAEMIPALPPSSESGTLAPLGTQASSEPDGLFASCMEAMVVSRDSEGASIQAAVTRMLSTKYPSVAHEVEDLVRWNMIDVCSDERERSRDALQAYLHRMARNAAISRVRKLGAQARYWSRNRCLIDERDDVITDFEEHQHREVTVARLLGELPSAKRALLEERYFDGLNYGEMAARRGMTSDSVSRATARARKAFHGQIVADCD